MEVASLAKKFSSISYFAKIFRGATFWRAFHSCGSDRNLRPLIDECSRNLARSRSYFLPAVPGEQSIVYRGDDSVSNRFESFAHRSMDRVYPRETVYAIGSHIENFRKCSSSRRSRPHFRLPNPRRHLRFDSKGSAKRPVIEPLPRSTITELEIDRIPDSSVSKQRRDTVRTAAVAARRFLFPFRSRLVTHLTTYRETYWRVQMVHPLLPAV